MDLRKEKNWNLRLKRRNFLSDISPNDISIIVALLPSPRIHKGKWISFALKFRRRGRPCDPEGCRWGENQSVYEGKSEWRVSASMYDSMEDAQSGEGKTGWSTVQQTPFVLSRPLGCAIFSQIQVTTELWTRFVDPRPADAQAFCQTVFRLYKGEQWGTFPARNSRLSLSLSLTHTNNEVSQ